MQLIKVKLLGELGRKFGRSYEFMANSPKDVMSALCNQLDGFKQYMIDAHEHGIGFKLINDDPDGMDYSNVLMGCNRLVIAPIVSGGGTMGRILIGVALVALAFVPGVGSIALATFGKTATTLGSVLFSIGTGLVLTGIASLLTPPVETPKGDAERKESFLFDRATELTSQGAPIPLLYGRFLAQSPLIISSSLSTQQAAV
jgi:predicted phage tail protein